MVAAVAAGCGQNPRQLLVGEWVETEASVQATNREIERVVAEENAKHPDLPVELPPAVTRLVNLFSDGSGVAGSLGSFRWVLDGDRLKAEGKQGVYVGRVVVLTKTDLKVDGKGYVWGEFKRVRR